MRETILATYRLGLTPHDSLEKKAEAIALGQTVGAWTPLPETDPAVWAQHRGEVVGTERLPAGQAGLTDGTAGLARIAFPTANCEPTIAVLLTMVFGKVSLDGRIKLLTLEFPPGWLAQFSGPKFGIPGLRQRLGLADQPLTMAIFKPCVGLSAQQLGAIFYELGVGGLDLIKDDEILPDLPTAPTEHRLEACLKAADRVKRETGRTVLYAINLTAPPGMLRQRAVELQALGATCFLLNALAYGWPVLEELAGDPGIRVPIIAHPALSGGLCGSPEHGMSYPLVLGTLMRLAGADIVLYPAHYGTFPFPAQDEFGIRDALREPWDHPTTCPRPGGPSSGAPPHGGADRWWGHSRHLAPSWPGPSVGIHPGMVPRLLADYGRDVVINAGGGIHGHKSGPRAGARAMRQAVELALAGRSFTDPLPSGHEELATAIQQWGVK